MRFHEYLSAYQECCDMNREIKSLGRVAFYSAACNGLLEPNGGSEPVQRKLLWPTENKWYEDVRPYYKVWPAFMGALMKVRLDVPASVLPCRERTIVIRFPDGAELCGDGYKLRSIISRVYITSDNVLTMFFAPQYIDRNGDPRHGGPVGFSAKSDRTIEEQIAGKILDQPGHPGFDINDLIGKACRIAFALNMLADDPDFVKPEVLAADKAKFDETGDAKYIDKAKRRGVVGWNVGAEFETIPHFRRPHLGLRWTGKGREVAKIVPIKGSVVHRELMTKVPTGYVLPTGEEVEGGKLVGNVKA